VKHPVRPGDALKWSRFSLFYLATYLIVTGVGFLLLPKWSLRVLFARGEYSEPFVQFVGAFMIALGTVVSQIVRFRLEVLYRITVFIRLFFLVVIAWLYKSTDDRLFLIIFGVVALGVTLTSTGILLDSRTSRRSLRAKEPMTD
jgi:uncharacterized protein YjeT (DUF2065 family)